PARVVLGCEHVVVECRRCGQDGSAKAHIALEAPGDVDVATGIQGNSRNTLVVAITESLAPDVVAIAVELGDEDVVLARAGERAATEVDRPRERSRQDD